MLRILYGEDLKLVEEAKIGEGVLAGGPIPEAFQGRCAGALRHLQQGFLQPFVELLHDASK